MAELKLKMEDHYIHNDIPVRIDTYIDGDLTDPKYATANVYDPDSTFIATGPAEHGGGEVKFIIPGERVNMEGIHTVVFKVGMPGMGEKEHVAKVRVIPLPIKEKEAESKDSNDKSTKTKLIKWLRRLDT